MNCKDQTINTFKTHPYFSDEDDFISLLPSYISPATLIVCDTLPCHKTGIKTRPTESILRELNRQVWTEGLYVRKNDLNKVKRYKNRDGTYKNDFNARQFLGWVITIEKNTVLCDMENKDVGKGVFVPYGKIIPKGTFIPSSGVIKLDPTVDELGTKVHCSALQDYNSRLKTIYGLIDPSQRGGILDLINHAPDKNEMANFDFQNPSIKKMVAISNLKSTIKFFNGYAIMGLEAFEDIDGGEYGVQLLWSYARSCEYLDKDLSTSGQSVLLLFDNRSAHNGKIIDPSFYSLRKIHIFINTGELTVQKIASFTRWELMEDSLDSGHLISMNFKLPNQTEAKQFLIEKKLLQTYLKKNLIADRIFLDIGEENGG